MSFKKRHFSLVEIYSEEWAEQLRVLSMEDFRRSKSALASTINCGSAKVELVVSNFLNSSLLFAKDSCIF